MYLKRVTQWTSNNLICGLMCAYTVTTSICFGSHVGLLSCPGSFQEKGHSWIIDHYVVSGSENIWGGGGGLETGGRRSEHGKRKRPKIVSVPEGNSPLFFWSSFGFLKSSLQLRFCVFSSSSLQIERSADLCQELLKSRQEISLQGASNTFWKEKIGFALRFPKQMQFF